MIYQSKHLQHTDVFTVLWETWATLLAPLALMLRLLRGEHLMNTGPAWIFWTLQAVYFYFLARHMN